MLKLGSLKMGSLVWADPNPKLLIRERRISLIPPNCSGNIRHSIS